jgi:hypothetical protein
MEILTNSLHLTHVALKNSTTRDLAVIAKLPCGAAIVAKLPRKNDTTDRLKVGFQRDPFSMIHWTGTVSAFASGAEGITAELKYILLEVEAYKSAKLAD